MKHLYLLVLFQIFSLKTFSQLRSPAVEIFMGNENADRDIEVYLEAVSTVWGAENQSDPSFYLTNEYNNSSYVIPKDHDPQHQNNWAGFDFVTSSTGNPPTYDIFGYGRYKIWTWALDADGNPSYKVHFYIDYRDDRYGSYDSTYGSVADIWVKYNDNNKRFYLKSGASHSWGDTISIGSSYTIWGIKRKGSPTTSKFEPYAPINVNATAYNGHPKITWQRGGTDDYVTGYDIYRSLTNRFTGYTKIGTSTSTSYIDYDLSTGPGKTAWYKVKAVNVTTLSAFSSYTSISYSGMQKTVNNPDSDHSGAFDYELQPNYPNPFNPTTTITYQIPKKGEVVLKVYNVLGKEVAELVNETKEKGIYTVTFEAGNFPSGMYFYKIRSGNFQDVKKMLLLR